MSEALRLADMVEGVRAPYCGAAAAELRRLSAELEALKKAISEAQPEAWLYELQFNGEWLTPAADIFDPRLHEENQETLRNVMSLYTLKGIK